MKDNTISLMAYPEKKQVLVETLEDFTLYLNDKKYQCYKGKNEIYL